MSDTLQITSSGIVLHGEGNDEKNTVLLGTGRKKYNLASSAGGAIAPLPATTQNITSGTVPVGARALNLADAARFRVGDTVFVTRSGNATWIHEIKMDQIKLYDPKRPAKTQLWKPFSLVFDRVVTRVEGNKLTLDALIANSIEQKWGGGQVAKYDGSARISHVGIENLFGLCEFNRSVTSEYKGCSSTVMV